MKKFTKSIYSIIMLCLVLAGNQAYSKNGRFLDEPRAVFAPPAQTLTALTRNATNFTIAFTPTSAGLSYILLRSVNGAAFAEVPFTLSGNAVLTDATVPTCTSTYAYKIKAYTVITDLSTDSNTLTNNGYGPPPVIAKPVIKATTIELGITSLPPGTVNYNVFRNSSQVGTNILAATTLFIDNYTAVPATTYSYQIQAKNAAGCQSIFSTAQSNTSDPLPKPTIVVARDNNAPQTRLNVSWTTTNTTTLDRWFLYRVGQAGSIFDGGPTQTLFIDGQNNGPLTPNTQYCYQVVGNYGNGGLSPYSDQKCFTTEKLPRVTNLSSTVNNCSRIVLNWTDTQGETNYLIYRSENGGAQTQIAKTGNNISSYTDDNLKPGTTYTYKIAGIFDPGGFVSEQSNETSGTTPPLVLSLDRFGATAADLSWNLCSQFTQGWKVFMTTGSDPKFKEIAQVDNKSSSYTVKNLIPETKYTFMVVPIFGTGLNGNSNVVTLNTPKFPGPTNLKLDPQSTTSIKLNWVDNSNGPDLEDAFIVFKSIDNGATYTQIQLPPTTQEYIDKDLKPSQKACYYVVARFENGYSEPSNTSCNLTCPTLITEFTKIEAISTTEISFQWNKPDNFGPTTIVIEGSLDGVTFAKLAEIPGTNTSYNDKDVLPNQKKYYRVNVKNEGTCSSIYSLIGSTTSCPLPPTNIIAKAVSSSTIEVVWDLVEGMKMYIIERSTDNIDFVKAGEVDGSKALFLDTKLASSKKYYYRVYAKNDGTCTSGASTVKQESTATTCAAAPSNVVAVANSAKEIKVTYTDNSPDETGFELEWSKDEKAWAKVGGIAAPNSTSITISTGVDPETKYFFRIRALGELCNSDYSTIASVTTNPPAPTTLAAKAVKINQIDLSWTNTSKTANNIEIQRASGADNNFAEIAKSAVASSSFQNTPLTPATAYKYRIRYTSPNGASEWSNIADATTFVISADENNSLDKQILAYPIPSDNSLYIKPAISILGKVSTKIVNITGATLISKDFNGFVAGKIEEINVSTLGTGMYFLEISSQKGKASKKFMKR